MGYNDHIDFELWDRIEELGADGLLEKGTPAYGVAQQVVHGSYDQLTPKQRYVYDKFVIPALRSQASERIQEE